MNPADSAAPPVIAVVDDDPSFLRSVGRLLDSAGYRVEMFGSGREFLATLPEGRPQCLVLDVHMPEMTGLQLRDQLAALGCHLPVIFVTAHDTPQTRAHAQRVGSCGFLLKPFDMRQLLSAIAEALHGPPPIDDIPPLPPVAGLDHPTGPGQHPLRH